jgi:flagellar protein FlgJ
MVAMAAPDTLAIDMSRMEALRAQAIKGDPAALRSAARQFEAMVVAQMLKTMRETRVVDEEDDPFGSSSMKLYQDLLDQQWAKRMSEGRGLGYAEMLGKAMEKCATQAATPAPEAATPPSRAVTPTLISSAQSPVRNDALPASANFSSTPATSASPQALETAEQRRRTFIDGLRAQAESAAQAMGIPADFILAHAALETGWGAKPLRDASGQASNNLFGIKSSGWQGASVEATTTEYIQGQAQRSRQGFRAYADQEQAFADYSRLLSARYGNALAAGNDARAFAQGLADAGYATDPAYAQKLESVIARVAMMGG